MRRVLSFIIAAMILISIAVDCHAQSIEKSKMLLRFDLNNEAKIELINFLYNNTSDADKSEALYLLGTIAFSENKIILAIDTWKELIAKYPDSNQSKIVQNSIRELSQIIVESKDTSTTNAVAKLYLSHGDFWSKDKHDRFMIDASWIPNVEAAIKWYNKVITEFPKSDAARIASQNKMKTLLGWQERGRDGDKYGIKDSFYKYMPQLLETFAEFEKEYPDDSSLQAFRYQIAQVYWMNKNWGKTKEWLNIIINKSGSNDDFYKDLAQMRLKKVEY